MRVRCLSWNVTAFRINKPFNRLASSDSRLKKFGRSIEDEFASIRDHYETPKHPIVLAHGLAGFNELKLGGKFLPGVLYWRGITAALSAKGIEVITTSVPPLASIEERAAILRDQVAAKAHGKSVNIIASVSCIAWYNHLYSLSNKIANRSRGLDSRYMIIATPHRGSSFADFCFDHLGGNVPKVYKALDSLGVGSGAFHQLTVNYMTNTFNRQVPDSEAVRYFSYGATLDPPLWSAFRQSHRIIDEKEGANDGLVSVQSSQWGTYKGTLVDVSHLDLINWTNRLRWFFLQLGGYKRNFNAIAFYLDIADMLAKEGL
ncbi:MAG: hypothetical protein M1814_006840 [Vezdaea aestivalis]|nr:MAG: hypothetical protein M1814_006840 [Vezdaea aestivalis]